MTPSPQALTLRGLPGRHVGAIRERLNEAGAKPLEIHFEQGEKPVIEGLLDLDEQASSLLLAFIGDEIERIVEPDYIICCMKRGDPQIQWRSTNARPDPSGW